MGDIFSFEGDTTLVFFEVINCPTREEGAGPSSFSGPVAASEGVESAGIKGMETAGMKGIDEVMGVGAGGVGLIGIE